MQERAVPARIVRFGAYLVDLRAGELHKNGHRIRLPEQPFQILTMLLEHPGEVLTREELQKRLWPADTFVDFDHGLNNAIKKLRDVLDDSAENPRYIETLPKRGYRFIHPVEAAVDAGLQPVLAVPWWRRPWVAVTLGALVIAAGLFASNLGGLRDWLLGRPTPGEIKSIAVLPLENLTGDPAQEYLVDGIHDELITELAQIASLSVPSRTTVMHYKKQQKSMAEVAHELKVDAVVEGTIKHTDRGLRITVQLIHAPTDRHLWADSFERSREEQATLPVAVARAIVGQLRIQVTPQEQGRLSRQRPVHPAAYEAFLAARYHFLSGRQGRSLKAKEYYEQAIRIDPSFARAYAGLAELYSMGAGELAKGPLDGRVNARQWAAKALELDDSLAEAHTALAWAELADWDWKGAEREFQRAITLNPNYALARVRYGWFLAGMQRFPEAHEEISHARRLDPVSPNINNAAAWVYIDAGRVDEAIACVQEILKREPDHSGSLTTLGFALLVKGEYQKAASVLEEASASGRGAFPRGMLAYAYAKVGQRDTAREITSELERRKASGENLPPLAVAYAHLGLGDKERALAWLEKDYEEHRWMWGLAVNPLLAPLRSDRRFADLVRRIGLPPAPGTQQGR
jgi:TolB-like protein/DNA-binding winged helix-turn-helix (wHTH) protein/Flp pilus assembly protein TadD